MFQIVLNGLIMPQKILKCSIMFKNVSEGSKRFYKGFRSILNALEGFRMFSNDL
jgi:hypothetical protein